MWEWPKPWQLPKRRPVGGHFVIHYALFNPRSGRGSQEHGVRGVSVVEEYAQALDRAYGVLTGPGHGWQEPAARPVDVYVCSLPRNAFGIAAPTLNGETKFGLARGGNDPRLSTVRRSRQAAAVHEFAHALEFEYRPAESWKWLDDASATAMESIVLPRSVDYYRFLPRWFSHPEESIDSKEGDCGYRSALFIKYLVRRFDGRLISRTYEIGRDAGGTKQAMEALAEAIRERRCKLASARDEEVFASGYCCDAYFIADPRSLLYDPRLDSRYGDRFITESVDEYPVVLQRTDDFIDHLGCRYYRFWPQDAASALRVTVKLPTVEARHHLRGELVAVTKSHCRGKQLSLHRPSVNANSMTATLTGFTERSVDHAVLVLANCACGRGIHAADGLTFRISAHLCGGLGGSQGAIAHRASPRPFA